MRIQVEIPWKHLTDRPLPVAVNPGASSADASGVVLFGDAAFVAESSGDGLLLVNFPLALFLRSLMASSPEVRGFVLDTIGKDALMVHFGLVGLNEPKGDGDAKE